MKIASMAGMYTSNTFTSESLNNPLVNTANQVVDKDSEHFEEASP